jgi:hypothetical protein
VHFKGQKTYIQVHTNYNYYKHVDNTTNDLRYDDISLCRSHGNPPGSFVMVTGVRNPLWSQSFVMVSVVHYSCSHSPWT